MILTETPICNFGWTAQDFSLKSVENKNWKLEDLKNPNGFLIMFICNHCPYVQRIRQSLIEDCKKMIAVGIKCLAINPNDAEKYPDDSFENMQRIAKEYQFPFPYCFDEDQQVAKNYNAVCTPDFFGFNSDGELQYRGRFDDQRMDENPAGAQHELLDAMLQIKATGQGPQQQIPSMGCSIKWRL